MDQYGKIQVKTYLSAEDLPKICLNLITNVRLPLVRFRIGGTNIEFVGGA